MAFFFFEFNIVADAGHDPTLFVLFHSLLA